jgi:signal transduction histidine kinase
VAKHPKAAGAEVSVVASRAMLRLSVRDDGVGGADPRAAGLAGLRERVAALGGRLELSSPPDGGTWLVACLPAGD